MKHIMRNVLRALLLANLLVGTALGASGCVFSTGQQGYICDSSDECNEGLRCYRFSSGGDSRGQCEAPGTREVSEGHRTAWIYMSWIGVVISPFILIWFILGKILDRRKQKAQQAGSPPSAPPGSPPVS